MGRFLRKIKELFDSKLDIDIDPKVLYNAGLQDTLREVYKQTVNKEYVDSIIKKMASVKEKFVPIKCIKCKKRLCYEKIMTYWEDETVTIITPQIKIYCKTCRQIEEIKK